MPGRHAVISVCFDVLRWKSNLEHEGGRDWPVDWDQDKNLGCVWLALSGFCIADGAWGVAVGVNVNFEGEVLALFPLASPIMRSGSGIDVTAARLN